MRTKEEMVQAMINKFGHEDRRTVLFAELAEISSHITATACFEILYNDADSEEEE